MNQSFKILRYIQKCMKQDGVPADAVSCDELERIVKIGKMAFESQGRDELYFKNVGNIWVSYMGIKHREKQ